MERIFYTKSYLTVSHFNTIFYVSNSNKIYLVFIYKNYWKLLERIRKYSQILLLAASFVFLVQFATIPLVHNHPADLHDHYNCPAFILTITFVTFFVSIVIKISLSVPFLKRISVTKKLEHINYVHRLAIKNRAPPF